MLSIGQKKEIRRICFFEYACREKDGKPITDHDKEFVIPSLNEIKESIFKEILKLGFSSIERVGPNNANCIIRVFQKSHYHYDDVLTYNIYGAACFTQKSGQWVTSSFGGSQDFKINFSQYIVRHWLHQDEYIDFDLDFFDCYVKVS